MAAITDRPSDGSDDGNGNGQWQVQGRIYASMCVSHRCSKAVSGTFRVAQIADRSPGIVVLFHKTYTQGGKRGRERQVCQIRADVPDCHNILNQIKTELEQGELDFSKKWLYARRDELSKQACTAAQVPVKRSRWAKHALDKDSMKDEIKPEVKEEPKVQRASPGDASSKRPWLLTALPPLAFD